MAEENKSLEELFASLKPVANRSQSSDVQDKPATSLLFNKSRAQPENTGSFMTSSQSSAAFPGFPGAIATPPSRQSNPPATEQSERGANLLNLLRFSQPSPTTGAPNPQAQAASSAARGIVQSQSPTGQSMHGRGISASDLVASYMGKPSISQSPGNATPSSMPDTHSPGANPQDYLLQLLNRSSAQTKMPTPKPAAPLAAADADKSSHGPSAASAIPEPGSSVAREGSAGSSARRESPIRYFGTDESKEPTPFDPDVVSNIDQAQPEKPAMFSYVNPFEQLAASSPLKNRSEAGTPAKETPPLSRLNSQDSRKARNESPAPGFSTPRTSLNANGHDILQSIEHSASKRPAEAQRAAERLTELGAPTTDKGTVAQALNEVGEQVNRQVEYALAHQQPLEQEREAEHAVERRLHDVAADIKQEFDEDDEMDALKALVPAQRAAEIKQVIDEAASGNVDGHHGSADDEESSGKVEEDIDVPVFNFPMRPFVSIDLQPKEAPGLVFRQTSITDIARLKKEFDQVDRILATASNNYIVYAMPKPGGFRIIRQDDGLDRQVFKETKDHVFNVAISNEAYNRKSKIGLETCIATAVSGTVYWTTLRRDGEDTLESHDFEQNSLIFPPVPAHDDNTSGGQLKTRAKRSSRHPDLFAIGRGKTIQIIFPLQAQASKFVGENRTVDTVNYFKERALRINMGKAGKDFTFSEDDTVIATLDKSGRLRLWDVQELVHESNATAGVIAPIEIKAPVLTFATAPATSKSWPTSVLFVDKARAYIKGYAQRYVIVGMKQNHTLQLWDLGLGKAVQELNFPHEKESDAICSIAYHAHSGIVVVGHPTRNSIYFIHLSAPKYNLQGMSQARYIQRLASQDASLPKPEATAIMSGMREYSFAPKGQLRSVDILPVTGENAVDKDDRGLFELYVMHSKGVTCLNVRKADLGWNEDNRVISSRSAEEAGYIIIRELREVLPANISEPSSVNGEPAASVTSKTQRKRITESPGKPADIHLDPSVSTENTMQNGGATATQEKTEKRKKKKTTNSTEEVAAIPPPAPVPPSASPAAASRALSSNSVQQVKDTPKSKKHTETLETSTELKSKRNMASSESISLGISPDFMDRELKKIRDAVSGEFSVVLSQELDGLRQKIDSDYTALDTAAKDRQTEVLRLVSDQLGGNVEKALSRIIMSNISQSVIPSIHNVTTSTLRNEIPDWLSKHLLQSLPAQLKLALPEAVTKAIQNPDVLKFMSDQITSKITGHIEKQISATLHNSLLPSLQTLVIDSAQKKIVESEKRINEQIRLANVQHEQTLAKLDQLTQLVKAFTETVHSMATSQAQFQSEILKTQQLQGVPRKESAASIPPSDAQSVKPLPAPELTPEQREVQAIDAAIHNGNYEQGVILWLQSARQTELFDEYFVRYDPKFLQGCSSLVVLSVIAALTIAIVKNIPQRLDWLATILEFIDPNDPEIREVAPRIMEVLCQRLESRFMEISEANQLDPVLRKFPPLTRRAREIAAACRQLEPARIL